MKTNIKLAFFSTLALMIIAQPAHGMQFVNKGIETAKKNWKPLAIGTVAVVGAFGLWKLYNNKQVIRQSQNFNLEDTFLNDIFNTNDEITIPHSPQQTTKQTITPPDAPEIINYIAALICIAKDGVPISNIKNIERDVNEFYNSAEKSFQTFSPTKQKSILLHNNKELLRWSQNNKNPLDKTIETWYQKANLLEKK